MSNPFKGEVTFEVDDGLYVLCFPIEAIIFLEERHDCSVTELGLMFGDGMRMSLLRDFFWAGLQKRQPDVSEEFAGDLLSRYGFARAAHLVRDSFQAAFAPAPAEGAGAGPRKRRRPGTGTSS